MAPFHQRRKLLAFEFYWLIMLEFAASTGGQEIIRFACAVHASANNTMLELQVYNDPRQVEISQ